MAEGAVPGSSSGEQVRVMLLSTGRATSTLFTKIMSLIPNSEIFMDTHYFCYEAENNLKLMGRVLSDDLPDEDWRKAAEMLVGEDCSGDQLDIDLLKFSRVKRALDNPDPDKKFIFCKSVTISLINHLRFLPDKSSNYRYSFLIRHPIKVFMSWRRALISVTPLIPTSAMKEKKSEEEFHFMRDAPDKYIFPGRLYKELYDQWLYVREHLDPNPIIIDSDDLLSDPKGVLTKYCAALGIPYSDSLLKWECSPEASDSWNVAFKPMRNFQFIKIMCTNALYSTGLRPPSQLPSIDDVSADVRESVEFVKPYWEKMYNDRIKP